MLANIAAPKGDAPSLPALREELAVYPGVRARDGSPTWILHDPTRNAFFCINWLVFEVLCRWNDGSPAQIAEDICQCTTLDVVEGDVTQVAEFMVRSELVRVLSVEGIGRLVDERKRREKPWMHKALHGYLFFRIPLVKPDRLLAGLLPLVSWIYTRAFIIATLLAALTGVFLLIRQWDVFAATLSETFNLSGLVWYGIALSVVKVLHEFGHGLTAKRYGCRVPTMGIAFLVLWPMLYTDVTEAWKLSSRRRRVTIGMAGIGAELIIAAWATLLWSFLPEGGLRTAASITVAVTWISSLLINISPFMRFDGYFVTMDALEMPNLHERAFAMGRWWLREWLFAIHEPAPERMTPPGQLAMVVFALGTWIYRLLLFLGIALLVYHFFIKLLGVAMFAVEILYFILFPIKREILQWLQRREVIMKSRRTWITLGLLALVAVVCILPWHTQVNGPALLKAGRYVTVYAPLPGRLQSINAEVGLQVEKGELLFDFALPDLEFQHLQAVHRIDLLKYELATISFDEEVRNRSIALREELSAAIAERLALESQWAKRLVKAPLGGRLVDLEPQLTLDQWLPAGQRLVGILEDSRPRIDAYLAEAEANRVAVGAAVRFYPENPDGRVLLGRVASVDSAPVGNLEDQALASMYGGDIVADQDSGEGLPKPKHALYRLRIEVDDMGAQLVGPQIRGRVAVAADPEGLLASVWRAILAGLLRESGV